MAWGKGILFLRLYPWRSEAQQNPGTLDMCDLNWSFIQLKCQKQKIGRNQSTGEVNVRPLFKKKIPSWMRTILGFIGWRNTRANGRMNIYTIYVWELCVPWFHDDGRGKLWWVWPRDKGGEYLLLNNTYMVCKTNKNRYFYEQISNCLNRVIYVSQNVNWLRQSLLMALVTFDVHRV